ncbi:hypothetical protein BpOF4_21869 (plasmid) [Alkalihalophilus pseudofirmus OF4]|uniref:Uncharacterized protein n=1 Tax=Alkalihalophilus pseudofirmus (strain ATCC BAA-2126 / JCM 17055 / OF4) TaxID=398511 RepID=D3G1Z3_ALKPO|nr:MULTISPECIES: hypothetical protein [Alkalihalophilus]ADC52369.1 hypothetical protein BpOF4_21869 [Alkalihalophilus pseudofirmus OF4]MED1603316.1 hypothetical protein [Alkalihalophilus marmarensis]
MKKLVTTLLLAICIVSYNTPVQSVIAMSDQVNKNLQDQANQGKDLIEWVALWDEPTTREGKLERMLTTELQRRTLFALQEKNYLKLGKQNVYYIDPFKITDMRTIDGGFSELDVIASVYRVIGDTAEKKAERFQITFRHNYEFGFVVTDCQRITE